VSGPDAIVLAHLVLGGTHLAFTVWPDGGNPPRQQPLDEQTARALLGLPALFVLVRELIRRFRYLDETIALVLVFVGLKLIVARWWHPGTALTLGIVVALFALGMAASFAAGDRFRRDGPGASG